MITLGGAISIAAYVWLYVTWKRDEEERYQQWERFLRERDERLKKNDTDIRHRDERSS